VSPKIGRPKKDVTKSVEIGLRLTKETADKLQRCADEMETTRTAVIERGIDLVEAELKK
jgi:predicted transcriptional regulator